MQPPTDTIVAVSSPPGRSMRGLIRMSGPGVSMVLDHLLDDATCPPRTLTPVRLSEPTLPALLLRFENPASYTGDDLAELQLPGNAALLDRVLHQAINTPDANARLAEPGEFTFRAYASGKLDLTQAEGIGATISAVSDSQLAAATLLRQGKLGKTAEKLVDLLGNLLALVEAGIDFTDQEDVTPIAAGLLNKKIAELACELNALLSRSRSWGAIESLPRVVLVGPPSVGKSTLFNRLLGRERAIIDATPGTTRDALAEPMQLTDADGRAVEVMLIDLAGIDAALTDQALAPDHVAQQVVHETVRKADLVLRISDNARWTALDSAAAMIDVLTKCDEKATPTLSSDNSPRRKVGVQAEENTNPHLAAGAITTPQTAPHAIRMSAHTGLGIDALKHAITQQLASHAVSIHADLLALQPRHEQAINDAVSALKLTQQQLSTSDPDRLDDIELLADSMRAALDALASLGGRLTPDEVIGRVFATFCVGK
ncbi:MAG: tRNA modification GTPase [Phycisphaeraceae bacterium]